MSLGRRRSTDEPLTEHDVAASLSRAALRAWQILLDARQLGVMDDVKKSRYLVAGTLEGLAAELKAWDVNSSDDA